MPDFPLNSLLAASQLCLQIVVAMERITNSSNSVFWGFFKITFCISLSVYDLDVHFLCSFLCMGSLLVELTLQTAPAVFLQIRFPAFSGEGRMDMN